MVALISFLLNVAASLFKSKSRLENVRGRVPFTNSDRLFSVELGLRAGRDPLCQHPRERYKEPVARAGQSRPAWSCAPLTKGRGTEHRPWLTALLARRPTKVAAIIAQAIPGDLVGKLLWATARSPISNASQWTWPDPRRTCRQARGR